MDGTSQGGAGVSPAPGLPIWQQAGRLRHDTAALLAFVAVASFHLAFLFGPLCLLVLVYLGCLHALRRVASARQAFYFGLAVGLGVFVPQMTFMWDIFGPAAIPLWIILSFFHGLFLLTLNRVEVRLGTRWAMWLAPVLWCGIEYFRSEVWWLRFAWFTAGSVFPAYRAVPFNGLGVYGLGFCLLAYAVALSRAFARPPSTRFVSSAFITAIAFASWVATTRSPLPSSSVPPVRVAGIQLEFPGPPEVLVSLDRLVREQPKAELILLSEYTFDGPVPDSVKAWCKRNRKWLVAGGKQPAAEAVRDLSAPGSSVETDGPGHPSASLADAVTAAKTSALRPLSAPSVGDGERYFNTAFVVSTNGEVVFTQAKSVPIQFFKDGEPATGQRVWDSPWGKLGIAICYDVSYRRVMDGLIRQGAQALLIPTMDVEQWGAHEHRLNARMARMRAAEYQVPIFRVASSGISQMIDRSGGQVATAPFPGPGAIIAGDLRIAELGGSIPLDRWLAPVSTLITGAVMIWLGVLGWRDRRAA